LAITPFFLLLAVNLLAWLYLLLFRGGYWRTDVQLAIRELVAAEASGAAPSARNSAVAVKRAGKGPCAASSAVAEKWEGGACPSADEGFGYPAVCVIVPARNEAEVLPKTLPALLRQSYPGRFRVVVVDDNSDDGTAEVGRRIGRELGASEQLTVVQAPPLPPGWAGKVWAMQQGLNTTTPADEFILFTDADIWHPVRSLQVLVEKATAEDLDLVSLMVRLHAVGFWERLLIPAFVLFFAKLYPFRWVNQRWRRTAAAAGGCILVRRTRIAKRGLTPIASALIDDCALARMVKDAGGSIWLGLGGDVLSLRPYPRLDDIWRMVARSAFVQLRYSPWLLLGVVVGMSFLYLLAPVGVILGLVELLVAPGTSDVIWTLGGGMLGWAMMALSYAPMLRWYRVSIGYAPLLPFAALLYTMMTVDSALRFWRRHGDMWKGRPFTASRVRLGGRN
jgi:hopene-associated glycosyltransferase HpnB